ncbi:class I SAM-dependent methyltransferase [Streptomyces lonarensis]|uniref:Class I SAM-dependent methyltransferase n=1 Tax=Streptomyces lonarensis TaxID=700599 RepID=A0A7X6D449_9ACTN|nr:class I SAM-dependent methyltransferase [Streptomyces lonarensis]NJQ07643.1 class I SAM-dependent methyltransferase [Streptomyces lonarensis]
MRFATDTTGKISLGHIYDRPDPRAYFSTLRALDYRIPQLAKPRFAELISRYREEHGARTVDVVDVGCSYGINAALYRLDLDMDDLYRRYADPAAAALTTEQLLDRDLRAARVRPRARARATAGVRFTGLDVSGPALAYAHRAGFLDATVHADLERDRATGAQRAALASADLVVSTGCFGYVTDRTLAQIADVEQGHRPWMAHFVLRMFSFDEVTERLAAAGYETVRSPEVFRQRRFASAQEREQVLTTLVEAGVDPTGHETDGWFCAQLYVSRPR